MRSVTSRVTETAGWRHSPAKAIHHLWMGDSFAPYLGLLLWATVAAAGFLVVDEVFNVWPATPPAWLVAIAAGAFALVDWAESAQNFMVAARGESPPRRAFLDSVYWTRALGVVLFLFGAGGVLVLPGDDRRRVYVAERCVERCSPGGQVLGAHLAGRRARRGPRCRAQSRLRALAHAARAHRDSSRRDRARDLYRRHSARHDRRLRSLATRRARPSTSGSRKVPSRRTVNDSPGSCYCCSWD